MQALPKSVLQGMPHLHWASLLKRVFGSQAPGTRQGISYKLLSAKSKILEKLLDSTSIQRSGERGSTTALIQGPGISMQDRYGSQRAAFLHRCAVCHQCSQLNSQGKQDKVFCCLSSTGQTCVILHWVAFGGKSMP